MQSLLGMNVQRLRVIGDESCKSCGRWDLVVVVAVVVFVVVVQMMQKKIHLKKYRPTSNIFFDRSLESFRDGHRLDRESVP